MRGFVFVLSLSVGALLATASATQAAAVQESVPVSFVVTNPCNREAVVATRSLPGRDGKKGIDARTTDRAARRTCRGSSSRSVECTTSSRRGRLQAFRECDLASNT